MAIGVADIRYENIDNPRNTARILILSIGTKEEVLSQWGHFFVNLIQRGHLVSFSGHSGKTPGRFPIFSASLRQGIRGLVQAQFQDIVVARGVLTALVLSLLLQITGRKVKLVAVDVGILHSVSDFARALLVAIMRLISGESIALLCYSRYELSLWKKEGIRNVHFFYLSQSPPRWTPNESVQPYVFSGGLTARDFRTLISAARGSEIDFVVVGGTDPVTGLDNLRQSNHPSNVAVERNVSQKRFEELIARATIVALPLLPVAYPVGQTVLATAMSYGKPVVATINSGTIDYVRDGETGLLVPPEDSTSLREAISELMNDEPLRRFFANNTLAITKRDFDPSHLATQFIQICDTLKFQT